MMMVRFDEEDPNGAPFSVRDREGESAASAAHGGAGRRRFFYRGGARLARSRNLLCSVLSALGDGSRHSGRNYPTSDGRMDGENGRRSVDAIDGALLPVRFVLHDRDRKFCAFETRFGRPAFNLSP